MQTNTLKFPIAGPIFLVMALLSLIGTIASGSAVLVGLLYVAVCVAMGVFLLMKRLDVLLAAGTAAAVLHGVVRFFSDLIYVLLSDVARYLPAGFKVLTIFGGLFYILGVIALFAVVLVFLPPISFLNMDFSPYRDTVKKLWFVAPIVMFLGSTLPYLYNLFAYFSISNFFYMIGQYIGAAIALLPWVFLCLWVINPYEKPKPAPAYQAAQPGYAPQQQAYAPQQQGYAPQQAYAPQQTAPMGGHPIDGAFQELIVHILLLLFIGPIWLYIWIYKTTNALNSVPGEKDRSTTTELLLSIFVPFYWLYWTYKSGQRIDTLAKMRGLQSDIAVLSLILSLLLGIVGPIIMQDKINNIIKAGKSVPVYHQ